MYRLSPTCRRPQQHIYSRAIGPVLQGILPVIPWLYRLTVFNSNTSVQSHHSGRTAPIPKPTIGVTAEVRRALVLEPSDR